MKILLVASTQFEIEPFLKEKRHMDVLITGVGIASATYHITKKLLHHHYDLVIQAGVAGLFANATGDDLPQLTEVVAVQKDVFGDLGAYEGKQMKSIADLRLTNDFEWLRNETPLLKKLPFKKVKAITVNTVTDNADIIDALEQKWQPVVESMEGAALHFVCMEKEIPFVQLRSTCNWVGERNKSNWQLAKAIENLNNAITETIAIAERKVPEAVH
jgi:futalosine hydrolase